MLCSPFDFTRNAFRSFAFLPFPMRKPRPFFLDTPAFFVSTCRKGWSSAAAVVCSSFLEAMNRSGSNQDELPAVCRKREEVWYGASML